MLFAVWGLGRVDCSTWTWEVRWPDHHCGGLQRVARAFPVVPLDPIEAIRVLALLVVDPVQVGRTAGVKPPAWNTRKQMVVIKKHRSSYSSRDARGAELLCVYYSSVYILQGIFYSLLFHIFLLCVAAFNAVRCGVLTMAYKHSSRNLLLLLSSTFVIVLFHQSSSAWSGTGRSPFRCDYCTAAGRTYTVCHSFNCRRCCGLSTGWVPLTHNCAPRANGCLPVVQKKPLMGKEKKRRKKRAGPRGFSASPCSLGRPPIQTETNFWQQSHFQGNRGGPLSYWKAEGKALFPGY